MRYSKIINRGKFAPGKILVVCIGQNQKDAREGAKGEGRHYRHCRHSRRLRE